MGVLYKVPSTSSNGGGTHGETSSKAGSFSYSNEGALIAKKVTSNDRQKDKDVMDTGVMKISNISSPNPFAALCDEEDEDDDIENVYDESVYMILVKKCDAVENELQMGAFATKALEGFRKVVLNVDGCAMYRVVKRLKGLKSPFRKLLHTQGNLHNRVNLLCRELDEIQKAIDKEPNNSDFREEHAHYLLAFKEAYLDKEIFLIQKS
ncbi:hypothetical protein Tco_1028623 [Tanacetum coccineum]|uniref:Uncharacterized protein n=1 Tax=Tanacetum coccineum TaxID=301880 RepID=A0ABQ5G3B1_9ASTR